jgi:MYXO-CTERM domain-containing protein
MSATTSLVKQLVSERSAANTSNGTAAASGSPSLSEIKAAAKEGTTEALAEYDRSADETGTDVTTAENERTENGSQGGSSLKRGALLVLVVVYLLRRRRSSSQPTDAQ